MALKGGIYVLFSVSLFILSIQYIHSKAPSLFLLVLIVAPVFLLGRIALTFRRKLSVEFTEQSFLFKIKKKETYTEYNFPLKDILFWCPKVAGRKYAVIKFFLSNGNSAEFSFILDDETNAEDIFNEFADYIVAYNKVSEEKIYVRPSFFATNSGLLSIYGFIILFLITVIVHAIKQFKTFPITMFLGFMMIIQILIRRSAEIKFYKKYNDLLNKVN
jgi:hypothetical protein